jgi:hypothetical protein
MDAIAAQQLQITTMRRELATVVEEYKFMEAEAALKDQQCDKLQRCLVDLARSYMVAIRILWTAITSPGSGMGSDASAQQDEGSAVFALRAALAAQARIAETLTAGPAALPGIAAAIAVPDAESLLAAAALIAAGTGPAENRRREREAFDSVVRELRGHVAALEADRQAAAERAEAEASRRRAAEMEVAELRQAVSQLQQSLSLAVSPAVRQQGESAAMRSLQEENDLLRAQLREAGAGKATLGGSPASTPDTAELVAAIASESTSYLNRAKDAEARVVALEAQLRASSEAAEEAAAGLRERVAAAEGASLALTRTATGLRHELGLAQVR